MSISPAAKGMLCTPLVAGLLVAAVASLLFLPMHHAISGPAPVAFSVPDWAGLTPPARSHVQAHYAALPLAFEENKGQANAQVKYMARGRGYTLFLTAKDATFSLRSKPFHRGLSELHGHDSFAGHESEKDPTAAVTMGLLNANSPGRVSASNLLPGKSNYFLSKDSRRWHTGVSHYGRVSYENVYPGVDLAFHGDQRQLEFDFVVAPHANPAPIAFHFLGANGIRTDTSGNLVIASGGGDVLLHKPVAYQQRNGVREPIESSFIVRAENQVSFALGTYDRSRELIIDPSVNYVYSTYLGGVADDAGEAIAIDSSGNAYIAGDTSSSDFPTTSGAQSTSYSGAGDVFVTKLSADGSTLLYSTFVGGTGLDGANGIAVDAAGDAFVDGTTSSGDFPITSGAYQTSLKGAANAFVFELNPAGSGFIYSTFLGGTGSDIARAIALDSSGSVYAVGTTTSIDFPTLNPVQSTQAGSFLTKLNSTGSGLVYSTYLGGGIGDSAFAVALDPSNNAYVTGKTISPSFPTTPGAFQTKCGSDGACNGLADAFVSAINAAGNAYIYSTFLGGGANDYGNGIAIDALGNAYVTGQTSSTDFPLSNPLQGIFGNGPADAFVTKLNPTGSALVYSTFLGGGNNDVGASIAVDIDNNAYITGQTNSTNFPVVGAVQSSNGGGYDAFVGEINGAGSQLTFSTFLGGSQDEDNLGNFGAVAVDSPGANIYVTGNTASTNFPTHVPFQAGNGGPGLTDAFAVKYAQNTFSLTATPPGAVSAGGSATSTVTLTAYNGYNSSVNLTCSVTPVASPVPVPACGTSSFSPPSPITPTSAGATTTLTITTTGPMAGTFRAHKFFYAMWLPITGLFLIGISSSGARRKRLFGLLMVSMVLFGLLLLPACGSVSGKTRQPTGGTPTGNYTITITGTGTDTNTTTQSTQITLTVN